MKNEMVIKLAIKKNEHANGDTHGKIKKQKFDGLVAQALKTLGRSAFQFHMSPEA